MNWSEKLDDFGRNLLRFLGTDPDWLPQDYNPVTRALRDSNLIDRLAAQDWFDTRTCRAAMSKVVTVCQMVVYDEQRGPEQDGKQKALRRHWYSYFKTEFAQPLSEQLGDDLQSEKWGLNWAGRLSQTYAKFVDCYGVTYRDLWVEDASRMMSKNWSTLFRGCHIIIAVEKDSLFSDFTAPAKALGAQTVYSGKGKSSKAAIEKVLREHFNWYDDSSNPFSEDDPLIILHISDHDFDGEAVIGPTFAEQARRYTPHILEARVGIKPETVTGLGHNPVEKWYQVKVTNSGYVKWAEEKALFLAECWECGNKWPVVGTTTDEYYVASSQHKCPECGENAIAFTAGKNGSPAHGYEVEALRTRDYYGLLVDTLLQVLPFDYILEKLRDECKADAYQAAQKIAQGIYEKNKSYQALLQEFGRLEAIKSGFERTVENNLQNLGEPHVDDWRDDGDDPKPDEFREHVTDASDWSEPWRPFDKDDRTDRLVKFLKEEEEETIADFENEIIEWK